MAKSKALDNLRFSLFMHSSFLFYLPFAVTNQESGHDFMFIEYRTTTIMAIQAPGLIGFPHDSYQIIPNKDCSCIVRCLGRFWERHWRCSSAYMVCLQLFASFSTLPSTGACVLIGSYTDALETPYVCIYLCK